jgi:hypothetical protein
MIKNKKIKTRDNNSDDITNKKARDNKSKRYDD